jgi:hypothetical protein
MYYNENMNRIIFITGTGIVVIIGLVFIFIRFYGLQIFNLSVQNRDKTPSYVLGEILVTVKPYTGTYKLDEFMNNHPELSKKPTNISIPSSATLSLKPYAEWQKKVSPSEKDNPQVRQAVINGETQLHGVYENLKTNPLLSNSNIWNSFYSGIEPEKNYFAIIHVFFKEGASQEEKTQFFKQYPQLEIVVDREESKTYVIIVPQRKEQYWLTEFLKQDFVKGAGLNELSHITQ